MLRSDGARPLCATLTLTLFGLLAPVPPAGAEPLNLILGDVDFVYDGETQQITDTVDPVAGNGDPAEADPVATAVLEHGWLDPVLLLNTVSPMHVDMQLEGLPSSLPLAAAGPQMFTTEGFGFEWFTDDGYYVQLSIPTANVWVTPFLMFVLSTEAIVVDQNLPSDVEFDSLVRFSFTSTIPEIEAGNGVMNATATTASGAVTISGGSTIIPEPTTALLFGAAFGAVLLAVALRS